MISIKSLEDLGAIAQQCVSMKMPQHSEVNLFGTEETFKELNSQLKNLGSGNVECLKYNKYGETDVSIDTICYCGYYFNLIYMKQ